MPIRKTPICPFCGGDMKRERGTVHYDGVKLITKLKRDDASGKELIENLWTFQVYQCEQCRFVALWQGDV